MAQQTAARQPIFFPKLLSTLKSYTPSLFWSDVSSGVIVGVIALPLAIAFAIASGVTPDKGIITAIIAGFLISALGGSRVQIGGPTGAFVVIVYHIVQVYGLSGLMAATFLAGIILVLMGVLRLGTIIKFIPYPLTVGFTSGIAVIIFSSQIRDFIGLETGALPADFLAKWEVYFRSFHTVNFSALGIALFSMAVLILWPKFKAGRKIPGSLVAVILATLVTHLLHLPVETIASRFGSLPTGFLQPALPHFSFSELQALIGPAFTIALLGAIESLLSATVADGMIESRHRSNTELIAQGIANIVSPLFGGMPATGAIARTAANIRNGGKTPVAGMVHAVTLLLILLVFGKWAGLIPLAALAAILVIVAYHMSEWRTFKTLLRSPRMDVTVLVTTFMLTILVDLTVAVEIGMVLSVFLFMKRMTDVTTVRDITQEMTEGADRQKFFEEEQLGSRILPPGVVIYEARGAFFFGAAEYLRDSLNLGTKSPRVVILRMRDALALDASGIRALEDLRKGCGKKGTQLILQGIHAQPLFALDHAGLLAGYGEENVVATLDEALERAEKILGTGAALKN